MNRYTKRCRGTLWAMAFTALFAGCDLFEVVNPGPIIDDA